MGLACRAAQALHAARPEAGARDNYYPHKNLVGSPRMCAQHGPARQHLRRRVRPARGRSAGRAAHRKVAENTPRPAAFTATRGRLNICPATSSAR